MKNVWTIIKKEFKRFFTDKRMIATILLPGILIYVLYSILGGIMADSTSVDEEYKPTVYSVNTPAQLAVPFNLAFDLTTENLTEEEAKSRVTAGTLDLYMVFPQNFTTELGTTPAPDVQIYYNTTSTTSYAGYSIATAVLNEINTTAFTVNKSLLKYDLAEESSFATQMLSMLVPMLMFALLASACVAVAPESIAGEKERGTMATMLITPIKRSELAIGKILSLTCFALLSGISSFLGVILSLPKLMGGMIGAEAAAMYTVGDYFLILAVIISVILVIISAFAVISCLAKSVKEATAFITPMMVVILLLGMSSMFFTTTPVVWYHLIPLLGSGIAISSIMSFTSSLLGVWLSVISNLVVAALLVVLLSFMFKSERIMFKR